MNLKEFDAKQFLLQKGEQVGLGIALTLMVLMLIYSLFWPSNGFFSGSPAAKAKPLTDGAKTLQNALNTRDIPEKYKPADTKGRLIDLDTDPLQPSLYEMTHYLFQPTAPENPERRPPTIYTLVEARVAALDVPIETYIFSRNYEQIYVLRDPEAKAAANPAAGGKNPLNQMYGKGMAGMPPGAGRPGGNANLQKTMGRFQGPNQATRNVVGADGKDNYEVVPVPLANVSMSEHFARQLQPARMAIIVGAFPYKRQLDEFQRKLRLGSVQEVLTETMDVETEKDKKEKLASFRFLGVEVERSEVDASGKTIQPWAKLDLEAPYKIWLMNSIHFEKDDSKYDAVKLDDLMMPRLREFREKSQQRQMNTMFPGMMSGAPGASGSRPAMDEEEPSRPRDSKYPDLAKDLPAINATLDKLAGTKPSKIARPPAQFRIRDSFKAFGSGTPAPPEEKRGQEEKVTVGDTIPEFGLVRVVDLDIQPGKFYRYRFKIRMANPNYGRDDVASTTYKQNKELESTEWYELKETVSLLPETVYYVVDEKKLHGKQKIPAESALAKMWLPNNPGSNQVAMQLHRWVESSPIDIKSTESVPIGEWAIADRVFIARGDYVGQTVKVDLPVWKYSQDSFVLPAEDQKSKKRGKVNTGVSVNFGSEKEDQQTILIDFEGGKDSIRETRISDTSAIEVLMLSPDGKLHARNSADDTSDETRAERREKTQKRIEELREGKTGGAGGGGGGGLDNRGK